MSDIIPRSFQEYSTKWGRNPESNCALNMFYYYSIDELMDMVFDAPRPDEMGKWGITIAREWFDALYTALIERGKYDPIPNS